MIPSIRTRYAWRKELGLKFEMQFPVSNEFLRPASNPDHYKNLVEELEAAPKRSWLASRLNKWKGFLRFS